MKKNAIAIFFSNDEMPRSGDQHFPFRQDAAMMALSGLDQPGSALLLNPGAADPDKRALGFILPPDTQHAVWNGKRLSKTEAKEISGLTQVYSINQWKKVTTPLFRSAGVIYINAELRDHPSFRVLNQNERNGLALQKEWPDKIFLSAKTILQKQMMIKHPVEIDLMKRAIEVTGKAFEEILKLVRPGWKEYEVEAEITRIFIRSGCTHAFSPIVASGPSACTLHYTRNDGVLKPGTLVLLDFGAEYAGMAADMSRTIPVSGRYSKRQKEIYLAILHILNSITDLMRPGMTLPKLNEETGKLMDDALLQLKLVSRRDLRHQDRSRPVRKKYFMHGIGHHLGWNVHDLYVPDAVLQPGMVITCEPGLYIPAEKTGIRLENDILITRNAPRNLMDPIPVDPDEIEALMHP